MPTAWDTMAPAVVHVILVRLVTVCKRTHHSASVAAAAAADDDVNT